MFDVEQIDTRPRDRLARGSLHRVMVTLNAPASRPAWQAVLLILFFCFLGGFVWALPQGEWAAAATIGVVLALFILGDIAILALLPVRRVSFASWKAQFPALALLRTAVALACGILSFWVGQTWAWWLFLAIQFAGTLLLVWGAHIEPAALQLTHLEVATERMARGVEPIRLLHISDLHIERLSRREDAILDYLESVRPDLIVITGDYLNLSYNLDPEAYRQVHTFLSRLAAPQGVYAVLGTPTVDLWELIAPLFDDLPVTLLRDQWHEINWADGRRLTLLGLDCTHDIDRDAARLQKLAAGAPSSSPSVLLYHSPELMPHAAELAIDLYLCGHTHGGQVRLPLFGPLLTSSQLGRRYVMGHYKEGQTNLYVSTGVGLEGLSAPRVRLLARPEITLITLKPA